MALIASLMGDEEQKIPVHSFFAGVQEVINGNLTSAQLKAYLDMDAAAQAEYDEIAATYPTGTTAAAYFARTTWVSRIHSIFILAEDKAPGYSTVAEVRTKLGL